MNIPLQGRTDGLIIGIPGQPFRGPQTRVRSRAHPDGAGAQQQIDVLTTLAVVETASVYTIRVLSTTPGVPFDTSYSVTTASTAGTALQDLLLARLLGDPLLGLVISKVVELTSLTLGITWAAGVVGTISITANPGTDLSIASTAAGWTQYRYGRFCEIVAGQIRPISFAGGPTVVYNVSTNATPANASATLSIDGRDFVWSAASGASAALTAAAIQAAIVALVPANTSVVVASPLITVSAGPGSSLGSTPVKTSSTLVVDTTQTAATRMVQEFAIVLQDYQTAPLEVASGITSLVGPRPGTAPLVGKTSGIEWVVERSPTDATPTDGAPVYAGADGIPLVTPAASTVRIPGARWTSLTSAAVGVLEY